jgi:hypothetical protein
MSRRLTIALSNYWNNLIRERRLYNRAIDRLNRKKSSIKLEVSSSRRLSPADYPYFTPQWFLYQAFANCDCHWCSNWNRMGVVKAEWLDLISQERVTKQKYTNVL